MPAGDELRRLVIVESPAKAKTIAGYLGAGYDVEASIGHIRDLPTPSELPAEEKKGRFGKFAVDVDHGFEPYYVVDPDKKKKVAELRRLLKDADELYLATDEDREGEAIAWHLLQVLEPSVPVRRMVFHEITRDAIREAVDNTRELDQRLVDAQETRRILDRLFGYEISPVLWRKVRAGLSAGRVQSVATRLVVERERDRIAFVRASYWDLEGVFAPGAFEARLVAVDGARVATGRDFDSLGVLTTKGAVALDESGATSLATGLADATFTVRSVEEKPYRRSPSAPFMTSTLQQEASRKLRMSSAVAMRVAQRLYENGHITYMRTDSTTLSASAIAAARTAATQIFGAENVSETPRQYTRKVKNAQEAHEAIRPSGDVFRTPGELAREVSPDELALYDLIWKRTVASQMSDARGQTVSVRLGAVAADGRDAEFGASGTVITHRGFLAAYEEGRDEPTGDDDERRLPALAVGAALTATSLDASGHETQPPARFTEATLVKALEERGIGRPSTYASILGVILDRGYVFKKGTALVPSWLAFAVTRLLEQHFGDLVDYDFTAQMEEDLDRIAAGETERVAWLTDFYFGGGAAVSPGSSGRTTSTGCVHSSRTSATSMRVRSTASTSARGHAAGRSLRAVRRAGRGAGLGAGGPAPDELTVARAEELLAAPSGDRSLGLNPENGQEILAKVGRFGPYVTEVLADGAGRGAKPRTASLFKEMSLDSVTLDEAVLLLSLPRTVGVDPTTSEAITAQNGRYGPYLLRGRDSRSLENEDQLFTVTLDEALVLYAQPKARGRGRGAAAAPLRELGADPVSGEQIVVRDGRFGPYVTDGETNATLRSADSVEAITLDRAAELLADKRSRGPAKKGAKKAAAKKSPAKKAAKKAAPEITSQEGRQGRRQVLTR